MYRFKRKFIDIPIHILQADQVILGLVKSHGTKRWKMIADSLEKNHGIAGWTPKQCRERWYNRLDPALNKDPITDEEEAKIYESYKVNGGKWVYIASQLNKR